MARTKQVDPVMLETLKEAARHDRKRRNLVAVLLLLGVVAVTVLVVMASKQ